MKVKGAYSMKGTLSLPDLQVTAQSWHRRTWNLRRGCEIMIELTLLAQKGKQMWTMIVLRSIEKNYLVLITTRISLKSSSRIESVTMVVDLAKHNVRLPLTLLSNAQVPQTTPVIVCSTISKWLITRSVLVQVISQIDHWALRSMTARFGSPQLLNIRDRKVTRHALAWSNSKF